MAHAAHRATSNRTIDEDYPAQNTPIINLRLAGSSERTGSAVHLPSSVSHNRVLISIPSVQGLNHSDSTLKENQWA